MSEQTKSPWHVVADNGCDFTAIATTPTIEGNMDLDKEVLGSSEWLRVKPADLRLMAAAPELLDALQSLLDGYGYVDFTSEDERNRDAAVMAAKAAILKAGGHDS